MPADPVRRARAWYARLLRLYPGPFRERFGEGMMQSLNDLCRERRDAGEGLSGLIVWVFAETTVGIMRENMKVHIMQNRNLIVIAIVTLALLLVPLVAMQFTDEVVWTPLDFATAFVLLFGAGFAYERFSRRGTGLAYRAAAGLAVGTGLLLIWANLAVGIIGSEQETANLLYFGVLAIGILGAILARLRPAGMSRALFATALSQGLVAVIALGAGLQRVAGSSVGEIVVINGFFMALFCMSALLFRRSARQSEPSRT